MSNNLKLKSKVISMVNYKSIDLKDHMPKFHPDYQQLDIDIDRMRKSHGIIQETNTIELGDMVTLSCQSILPRFNKENVIVVVGRNLYSQELESQLIGMNKGEKEIKVDGTLVKVNILAIQHTIIPEFNDETVIGWNIESIKSVEDLKRYCINRQIDAFRDENEEADILVSYLYTQIVEKSKFDLHEEELEIVERSVKKKIYELQSKNNDLFEEETVDMEELVNQMMVGNLKGATIGYKICENENKLLTIDDYMAEILKRVQWLNITKEEAMEEYSQIEFTIDTYSEYFFSIIDEFIGNLMKENYNKLERMIYDVAIIGGGPAGLSAALNFKLHNKKIIWFGSSQLSDKVEKSEKIANYPGFNMISGKDLNDYFRKQMDNMELELTDQMVTSLSKTRQGYVLTAENDIYEAKTILLATGLTAAKGFQNENELLGKGVSYCATCDGFLYKEKTIAIYCATKRYEHEVKYLAEMAKEVYLYAPYKDVDISLSNVKMLKSPIMTICGQNHVESIELKDGTKIGVDGIFIMRTAVAPTTLIKGIEMEGPHIVVDRNMATNKEGCYAAGDCTGRPYQITKAVGEGNIAAHSIIEYLAKK